MPLKSIELHKMAYFTYNQKYSKPMKMIILPYLHERRIYLNKMKPGKKYYYTFFKNKEDQGVVEEHNEFMVLNTTS